VTFNPGTNYHVALNGTNPGVGFTQLSTGTVSLNNATLNAVLTNFIPALGDTFAIVTSTSAVSGTFNGLPDGAFLTLGGLRFQIHYNTTTSAAERRPNLPTFGVFLVRTDTPTTTTFTASATAVALGDLVTFTVAVQAAPAVGIPSGAVTFLDGSTQLAPPHRPGQRGPGRLHHRVHVPGRAHDQRLLHGPDQHVRTEYGRPDAHRHLAPASA
jgi:hypothetical protein